MAISNLTISDFEAFFQLIKPNQGIKSELFKSKGQCPSLLVSRMTQLPQIWNLQLRLRMEAIFPTIFHKKTGRLWGLCYKCTDVQ